MGRLPAEQIVQVSSEYVFYNVSQTTSCILLVLGFRPVKTHPHYLTVLNPAITGCHSTAVCCSKDVKFLTTSKPTIAKNKIRTVLDPRSPLR